MTYMTAMDRLEMRCIFVLEGLWGTEAGTGAGLDSTQRSSRAWVSGTTPSPSVSKEASFLSPVPPAAALESFD